jgi:hypothetical protein
MAAEPEPVDASVEGALTRPSATFALHPMKGEGAGALPEPTARQLWLFKPPRPSLEARLGAPFFQSVPSAPGVYLMSAGGRVLYVGMSTNLRKRLASYRLVKPGREGRKTMRLVHAVERIEWELCDSEASAVLRENALIREHRPRFNRVGVWPEANGFIGLRVRTSGVALCLCNGPLEGWQLFGAFKAGRRPAVASLNRLLAWANDPGKSTVDFPASWEARSGVGEAEGASHLVPDDAVDLLVRFLEGRDSAFLDWLRQALTPDRSASRFDEQLKLAEIDALAEFFANGPQRIQELRVMMPTAPPLLPRLELDDWLARARRAAADGK